MAIRTRILAVVLALLLVALAALGIVTYTVVRQSLVSRADAQLQTASSSFKSALQQELPGFGAPRSACYGLPDNSFGTLYYTNGSATAATVACPTASNGSALARLPASVVNSAAAQPSSPWFTTVVASSGAYRIEAQLVTVQGSSTPFVFVVGEPMRPVFTTLREVLFLELLVSVAILLAGGTAAFFLVQLGLRPLEEMAETAGEIAAGDLSRRVDDTDPRTEVGELGASLNVMLSRIEQAFRAKEASEEQLRRFVADASHELRTPLTSIRGYAELFRYGRTPNSDDLAAALRRIESESERMSGLVEDLLLLARLDQGRPLERSPVDLAAVAEDAARDARVVAPDRQVTLRTAGDSVDVIALGDEERLRQVAANLLSNALAHTPPGTPVEVVADREADQVRLAVIDHGPGIGPEERLKIFDRFWRADESRHRAGGGTGLGLSIVAAVVSAHGGQVLVEDTPGGGATFVVELPAAVAAASDDGYDGGYGAGSDDGYGAGFDAFGAADVPEAAAAARAARDPAGNSSAQAETAAGGGGGRGARGGDRWPPTKDAFDHEHAEVPSYLPE